VNCGVKITKGILKRSEGNLFYDVSENDSYKSKHVAWCTLFVTYKLMIINAED